MATTSRLISQDVNNSGNDGVSQKPISAIAMKECRITEYLPNADVKEDLERVLINPILNELAKTFKWNVNTPSNVVFGKNNKLIKKSNHNHLYYFGFQPWCDIASPPFSGVSRLNTVMIDCNIKTNEFPNGLWIIIDFWSFDKTLIKSRWDKMDNIMSNKLSRQLIKIPKRPKDKIDMNPEFLIEMGSIGVVFEVFGDINQETIDKIKNNIKENRCIVCLNKPREIRSQCGHGIVCKACDEILKDNSDLCPICRKERGVGILSQCDESYRND